MSGYISLLYVACLIVSGVLLIFFMELHEGYLNPLQDDFTGEDDLDTYAGLFMRALIPMSIFISSTIWYITVMQRRRQLA